MNKKEFSKSFIKIYAAGLILGTVTALLFILIFSGLLLLLEWDRMLALPIAALTIAAGAFTASFFIASKTGNNGLKNGALTGLFYFILITLIAAAVCKGEFSLNTLFHFVIIELSGMIGGIIGVNRKNRRKYI